MDSADLSRIPPHVPDSKLVFRPNPSYPGHDEWGFRNRSVPLTANVVALGDSQTYGTGVTLEEAWTKQLESLSHETVYSMAFGGYGPVHSLVLWEEALRLSPTNIIEAFYSGNDLFDSFSLVYNHGQFPELKSNDPGVVRRIHELETSSPIEKTVANLFSMGTQQLPGCCEQFDDGKLRTIFTSRYRLAAVDQTDPRISEGLSISLRAIEKMEGMARTRNIHFTVLLIPTKEMVFKDLLKNPSEDYLRLIENEHKVWTTIQKFMDTHHIDVIDVLPSLQKALRNGTQPYQVSQDGHPNAQGHKVIATTLSLHLRQLHSGVRDGS